MGWVNSQYATCGMVKVGLSARVVQGPVAFLPVVPFQDCTYAEAPSSCGQWQIDPWNRRPNLQRPWAMSRHFDGEGDRRCCTFLGAVTHPLGAEPVACPLA